MSVFAAKSFESYSVRLSSHSPQDRPIPGKHPCPTLDPGATARYAGLSPFNPKLEGLPRQLTRVLEHRAILKRIEIPNQSMADSKCLSLATSDVQETCRNDRSLDPSPPATPGSPQKYPHNQHLVEVPMPHPRSRIFPAKGLGWDHSRSSVWGILLGIGSTP